MTVASSFESLTIASEISVRDCGSRKDWNLAQVPVRISEFPYLFAEILHHMFFEKPHNVLYRNKVSLILKRPGDKMTVFFRSLLIFKYH